MYHRALSVAQFRLLHAWGRSTGELTGRRDYQAREHSCDRPRTPRDRGIQFPASSRAYHQPQRSQEMGTRQAETYMTGPQRGFQPGRTSSHPVPVPSNNWPTSFSPEEIRQVQTIYSITFGATYTGNIGSFYRRPVPQQLITASIRSSASPGMPPSNTFGPQHHQNVGTASRLLPPIFSTGYGHRSSDNNEKVSQNPGHSIHFPHSAPSPNITLTTSSHLFNPR